MGALASRLLGHLDGEIAKDVEALPDLEARLATAVAEARAAWPTVTLDDATFLRHLARKVPAGEAGPWLETLRAAELYLACACARGDTAAIVAFERAHGAEIDIACRQRTDLTLGRDDVAQLVRARLLVGPDPRIADYSGRGSLRSWFRVAVVRLVSNAAARPRREISVEEDALAALPILTADPELEYMKRLYQAEFRAALTDAVGALDARERKLLRRSLVEGMSIDQLAVLHGAHRATLARWIAQAREQLLRTFRGALMTRLSLDARELDALLGLVRSRFDITIERLFASAA